MAARVYDTNIQSARLRARGALSQLVLSHVIAQEQSRPCLSEEEHDAAAYLLDLLTERYDLQEPTLLQPLLALPATDR